jgi:hypothetical protein
MHPPWRVGGYGHDEIRPLHLDPDLVPQMAGSVTNLLAHDIGRADEIAPPHEAESPGGEPALEKIALTHTHYYNRSAGPVSRRFPAGPPILLKISLSLTHYSV